MNDEWRKNDKIRMNEKRRVTAFVILSFVLHSSFQSSFIKLDQIEIGPNIFAALAPCLFEKMEEARLFGSGVGMPGSHCLVPLLNLFRRILCSIFLHPL